MSNRIYSVIENKKRELDSRIFFALLMNEKGFTVGFGKKQNLYQYSKYLGNGLFMLKSLGERNLQTIINLKKNGHLVSSWDEEGFVTFDEKFTKLRNNVNCLKEIEYLYAWGSKQKKVLQNFLPEFKEKIVSSGHPRFDILKKKYRSFFEYEKNKIINQYGKFVLITTRFPMGNSSIAEIRSKIKKPSEFAIKDTNFQQKTMKVFVEFLKVVSKKFPEIKVILRPHPGENISIWRDICQDFENIKVVYDHQNTCSWILASQYIISTNCHTSMEAYLLGKQSINFAPIENKEVEFEIFKKVSHNISKLDDLVNSFSNSLKNDFKIASKDYDIDYLLDNIANHEKDSIELMYQTIKDTLNKILESKDKRHSDINFLIFRIIKKLKNYKNNIFQNKDIKKLSSQKFDILTLDEIKEKVQRYNFRFDIEKILISEKYPGVFIFERQK